ncbi:MAG: alpha/beta hydrolase [Burkholderiales bacterium]
MAGIEREVTLDRRDVLLSGTLTLPDALGTPRTVALFVAGSGPTDRDGNGPALGLRTDCLKQLAAALASGGVASLRYDKRGDGRSAAGPTDESALRFEHFVDDAAEWARRLAVDPRFDRVAVLGHSEGALIAALCASHAPAVDHVLKLAGGDAASRAASYTHPERPLAPGLADGILRFLADLR